MSHARPLATLLLLLQCNTVFHRFGAPFLRYICKFTSISCYGDFLLRTWPSWKYNLHTKQMCVVCFKSFYCECLRFYGDCGLCCVKLFWRERELWTQWGFLHSAESFPLHCIRWILKIKSIRNISGKNLCSNRRKFVVYPFKNLKNCLDL